MDSDIPERLIEKEDSQKPGLTPFQTEVASTLFRSRIPEIEGAQFIVSFQSTSPDADPATVTQNEYMRRMKEMAAMQPGAGFYGSLPDSYSLIVNTLQPAVKDVIEKASENLKATVEPAFTEIESINKEVAELRGQVDGKKEMPEDEKRASDLREINEKAIAEYAGGQPVVLQIIDLALLRANLLKGEDLKRFISRSISMLK